VLTERVVVAVVWGGGRVRSELPSRRETTQAMERLREEIAALETQNRALDAEHELRSKQFSLCEPPPLPPSPHFCVSGHRRRGSRLRLASAGVPCADSRWGPSHAVISG
jgi:hypothetical protein